MAMRKPGLQRPLYSTVVWERDGMAGRLGIPGEMMDPELYNMQHGQPSEWSVSDLGSVCCLRLASVSHAHTDGLGEGKR